MSIPTAQAQPWTFFDLSDQLPRLTKSTAAGISVAVAGNIIISLALNCQKLAHRRLEEARNRESGVQPTGVGSSSTARRDSIRIDVIVPTSPRNDGTVTESSVDPFPSANTVVETEPLLNGAAHASYGADTGSGHAPQLAHKPSWYSRIWSPESKRRQLIHDADDTHLASTHALMPVDIVHTTQPQDGHPGKNADESENESDYLKSKLWWVGFLLMNLGEMGNFISYGFAPASVVAPLGTFALIANCLFAPLILGERFRKRDFFGILVAIIGAVTVVLSANASDTHLTPKALIKAISQRVFIGYASVYIVGAIILSGLSERDVGRRWVYVDVGLCALFGGFTVLSTKAISSLLTLEWFQIFTEWITYPVIAVLIGTGVSQIKYLNRALMRFDSKIVVPTQFVFFNLSAILGSAILYGDFRRATFHQIVTFLYGCAATFAGVFIIAWSPASTPSEEEDIFDSEDPSGLDGVQSGRNSVLGSLGRRNRATLVVPDSTPITPILNRKKSISFGFSPAQRVLILHTPPSDDYIRPHPHDAEYAGTSTPDSIGRRRAISWFGDDLHPNRYQNLRSVTSNSDAGSRSQSLTGIRNSSIESNANLP